MLTNHIQTDWSTSRSPFPPPLPPGHPMAQAHLMAGLGGPAGILSRYTSLPTWWRVAKIWIKMGFWSDCIFVFILIFVTQVGPARVARDASGGSSHARGHGARQPTGPARELQAELWGHDQALARVSLFQNIHLYSYFLLKSAIVFHCNNFLSVSVYMYLMWFACVISWWCCRNQSSVQKGEYLDWDSGEKEALWDRRINRPWFTVQLHNRIRRVTSDTRELCNNKYKIQKIQNTNTKNRGGTQSSSTIVFDEWRAIQREESSVRHRNLQ